MENLNSQYEHGQTMEQTRGLCLCFFCLVFAIVASVYMCLVVTCWEKADLLALVCGVLL